jgi:hypothetical protein
MGGRWATRPPCRALAVTPLVATVLSTGSVRTRPNWARAIYRQRTPRRQEGEGEMAAVRLRPYAGTPATNGLRVSTLSL